MRAARAATSPGLAGRAVPSGTAGKSSQHRPRARRRRAEHAEAVKHAVACGIDCIEHGFLMDDEAIQALVESGLLSR